MSTHVLPAASRGLIGPVPPIQVLLLAAYGVVLWLLAAMVIRYGTPSGWFAGMAGVVTYAVAIGGFFALVLTGARRLGAGAVLPSVTIVAAAALFCDGATLTWFPWLYAADAASMLPGLAWLFFGVSACLLLACAADRR